MKYLILSYLMNSWISIWTYVPFHSYVFKSTEGKEIWMFYLSFDFSVSGFLTHMCD